ncbi:hypothetical protein HAX54_011521 [Datura stramonium]|uniref:Uncharacterized protein n=1 Tax=Datura stramonium TaxID=4076 RepID=A0ABS8TK36_DATST|nr:hypothetical protein [Datura stramonium]
MEEIEVETGRVELLTEISGITTSFGGGGLRSIYSVNSRDLRVQGHFEATSMAVPPTTIRTVTTATQTLEVATKETEQRKKRYRGVSKDHGKNGQQKQEIHKKQQKFD